MTKCYYHGTSDHKEGAAEELIPVTTWRVEWGSRGAHTSDHKEGGVGKQRSSYQ